MGCKPSNLGFTERSLAHGRYVGIDLVFGAGQGRSQPARIGFTLERVRMSLSICAIQRITAKFRHEQRANAKPHKRLPSAYS